MRFTRSGIPGLLALLVCCPALAAAVSAPAARAQRTHMTPISITGKHPGPVFGGIGAISGAGGNSRYLLDYPEPERGEILNYLFTPGYGASLQLLKLGIGGDANASDAAEASVEHAEGSIDCHAGYEWWIARQAVDRNPGIRLYGLQWAAPGRPAR